MAGGGAGRPGPGFDAPCPPTADLAALCAGQGQIGGTEGNALMADLVLADEFVSLFLSSFALLYFGSPTAYPYLRPMTRYLCAGVGVVVRILINILAGRECACVCV